MESINNYKEQVKQLRSLTSRDSLSTDFFPYVVTEEYYNKIVKAASLLVDFEKKYLHLIYNL